MAEFKYHLAESAIRLAGRRVVVSDPYDAENSQRVTLEDAEVDLLHLAQSDHQIDVSLDRGDRDFSASFTPDARLQSLEYNSTGAGAAIVSGMAKFIAFAGSVVLAVLRGGALSDADGNPLDPRAEWEKAHPELPPRRESYVDMAKAAASELASVRALMVKAERHALRELESRARSLERLVDVATAEVAAIEKLYAEWRDAQRSRSQSDVEVRLLVSDLPRRSADGYVAPPHPNEGETGYAIWRDFGLFLEVIDEYTTDLPDGPPASDEPNLIWWRQPREVELWVWKRDVDGAMAIVSHAPIRISDRACAYRHMELTSSMFGAHGGSLVFNDDGSPSKLTHNQESAWAAFAAALGGVPEAVAGGVTQAKSVLDGVTSMRDAQAERERAAAARELEIAENRLKLAGVDATEADYADLQRAEQAVKLRTARRSLSAGADTLDDLKQQLDLVTTQNKIESERRTEEIASNVADLKAEVARIELEVKKVEELAKLPK